MGRCFGQAFRHAQKECKLTLYSLTNVKPINVSKPFGMRKGMQALVTQKTRGIIAEDLKSKYMVSKIWQAFRHAQLL